MATIRTRVTQLKKSLALPQWTVEPVAMVELLKLHGVSKSLPERLRIQREGGYGGEDLAMTGLLYNCSPKDAGIKGFCKEARPYSVRLAALFGRKRLPASASVSRLLAASDRLQDPDDVATWLLSEGSCCRDLLADPLTQSLDTNGFYWSVFDFDPSVDALRQRALPEGDDLPPPMRRARKLCAPGYSGRHRGEVQYSTAFLSHAGSSLWLQATVSAGNTHFAEAVGVAAKTVAKVTDWAGLDRQFSLMRFDGAGGHGPAMAAVAGQGVHFLARLASCVVLEDPQVQAWLASAIWREVTDSGSGPRRHATELGTWVVSADAYALSTPEQPGQRVRLVASRFVSSDGKKHGAGKVMDGFQYEVFATDIDAAAWPAADTVTLYYGRCGQENLFGRASKDLSLGQVSSYEPAGQRLMTVLAMWTSNLRSVLAAASVGDLGARPSPTTRPPEPTGVLPSIDVASIEPPNEPACAPSASNEDAASIVEPIEVTEDFGQVSPSVTAVATDAPSAADTPPPSLSAQTPPQPTLAMAVALVCIAGIALPLHGLRRLVGGKPYAIYRAPAGICGPCPKRAQCIRSNQLKYRKEIAIAATEQDILDRDRILSEIRALGSTLATPTARPDAAQKRPSKPNDAPQLPKPPPPPPPEPRWQPPKTKPGGPWLSEPSRLLVPVILAEWKNKLQQSQVEIDVCAKAMPRTIPWISQGAEHRQGRRQTWATRREFNALHGTVNVNVATASGDELWPKYQRKAA